jgi:hypothetical protein
MDYDLDIDRKDLVDKKSAAQTISHRCSYEEPASFSTAEPDTINLNPEKLRSGEQGKYDTSYRPHIQHS